jgi:hypothetical protein
MYFMLPMITRAPAMYFMLPDDHPRTRRLTP